MTGTANSQMAPQVDKILSLENTINANQLTLKSASPPPNASEAVALRREIGAAFREIYGIVKETLDNSTAKYGLSVLSDRYSIRRLSETAMGYNARGKAFGKRADPPQNIDYPSITDFYVRNPDGINADRYTLNEDGSSFVRFDEL